MSTVYVNIYIYIPINVSLPYKSTLNLKYFLYVLFQRVRRRTGANYAVNSGKTNGSVGGGDETTTRTIAEGGTTTGEPNKCYTYWILAFLFDAES